MATATPKLTQEHRQQIVQALDGLAATHDRRANARGVDAELANIYKRKAAETRALRDRFASGELDL